MAVRNVVTALVCGAALLAGGVFAGTVVGDDGSSDVVDRIQGEIDPAAADVETVRNLRPVADASAGRRVKILRGRSSTRTFGSGDLSAVVMRCPVGFSALSSGYAARDPGVVPATLAPALRASGDVDERSTFVVVLNISGATLEWRAWVTCAKGVRDLG